VRDAECNKVPQRESTAATGSLRDVQSTAVSVNSTSVSRHRTLSVKR